MIHGTSTIVLEPDPGWTGFDPVPQLCLWRPVKDYVWPKRQSSLRSRSTGAKGQGDQITPRRPCFVHRPGDEVVSSFSSINAAMVFLERRDYGKLRAKLRGGKVHTWGDGVRQWTPAAQCPDDLQNLPVVDRGRNKVAGGR